MTFGRRWVAVVAVLPLLAVGACAEESVPKYQPPSETPTSETSSPAPEPEPWEEKSKAGAVAFAKHWIDVFNEAQASGETDAMRSISTKDCGSCNGFASQLEDLYGDGGILDSEGWTVVDASAADGTSAGRAVVALRVDRSPQVVRPADGDPQRFKGGKATFSARLTWRSDSWVMDELELLT